jgi:hypothetical protein
VSWRALGRYEGCLGSKNTPCSSRHRVRTANCRI